MDKVSRVGSRSVLIYRTNGVCIGAYYKCSCRGSLILFWHRERSLPIGRVLSISICLLGQDYEELHLVRGKPIKVDSSSKLSVREVGNFVVVDTPYQLTLHWDKGTRIYITMQNIHSNKVPVIHQPISFTPLTPPPLKFLFTDSTPSS